MANYTAIATGAAANASTFNAPLGQLDAAIGDLATITGGAESSVVAAINSRIGADAVLSATISALTGIVEGITGSSSVTAQQLKDWTEAESYEVLAITYSTNYPDVVASATLKWPDGSAGTFTSTTINASFICVDAYTVSHTASSKTVTQAAVTRDSEGKVTTKPALTVA